MSLSDQQYAEHERRILALEYADQELRSELRVAEVRREHIDKQFEQVFTRFNKTDSNITRLVFIVLGAIASAGVAFVVNGGMAGV